MTTTTIEISPNAATLAEAAGVHLVRCAEASIGARGHCLLALSGGETPRATYAWLADHARTAIDWTRVYLFWSDERCVPPDHPESNYRMARETLLDHLPIPAAQVHRLEGELPPNEAADRYEAMLRTEWGSSDDPYPPRFDAILLGMGADGHAASLFPGVPIPPERWVAAVYVPQFAAWRLTMTPTLLNAAAETLILVAGREKAERVAAVLDGPYCPDEQPIQRIAPQNGLCRWLLDAAAAAEIVIP